MQPKYDEEQLQRLMDGDLSASEEADLRATLADGPEGSAAREALARYERMGDLMRTTGEYWQQQVDSEALYARIAADIEAGATEDASDDAAVTGTPALADPSPDAVDADNVVRPEPSFWQRAARSHTLVPLAGAVAVAAALLLTVFRPVDPEALEGPVTGEPAAQPDPAPTPGHNTMAPNATAEATSDQTAEPTAEDSTEAAARPGEAPTSTEVVQVDFGEHAGTVFDVTLSDGASTPVIWINE